MEKKFPAAFIAYRNADGTLVRSDIHYSTTGYVNIFEAFVENASKGKWPGRVYSFHKAEHLQTQLAEFAKEDSKDPINGLYPGYKNCVNAYSCGTDNWIIEKCHLCEVPENMVINTNDMLVVCIPEQFLPIVVVASTPNFRINTEGREPEYSVMANLGSSRDYVSNYRSDYH